MKRTYSEMEKENLSSNIEAGEIQNFQNEQILQNNVTFEKNNYELTSRKSFKSHKEKEDIKTFCRIRPIESDAGNLEIIL